MITKTNQKATRPVSPKGVKVAAPKLRKIALAHQGLLNSASFGKGKAAVAKTIEHIGYVQIDTISVVERAHHHVLWSRCNDYQADHLESLVEDRKIFEYWYHAAAFLPMADFRFALPRMQAIKAGEKHWFENIDKKLIRQVRKRIEAEGPLRARDFADTRKTNTGWWDWKPAKQALEKLFMQGDLMVVAREGFQKRYDLTERVLPDHVDTRFPDITEQAQHLIDTTIRSHGFSSLKSFSYLRKGKELRIAIKRCVDERVDQGQLVLIESSSGEPYYCDAVLLKRSYRTAQVLKLLSPFDNLLIQRERCRQVFTFDYQIECYVPAAKRQFGYFSLPMLFKDQLVGRVDCKADRKTHVLHVLSLQHSIDSNEFLQCLSMELNRFMKFNKCQTISIASTVKLKKRLQQYLK